MKQEKSELSIKSTSVSQKGRGDLMKDIYWPEIIQDHKQKWTQFLYFGVFMLSLLLFPILFSTVLFVFHVPITVVNMPLSVVAACIVLYILTDRSKKNTAIIAIMGMLLTVITVILCMRVYDWTWDGNSYHKSILGLLRYGWNPLYETFQQYGSEKFSFLVGANGVWLNTYTKGSEIWGACIYAVCNDIESGKAFNLISMIAAFCVCLGLLGQTERVKPWQAALCVFLCVVNPISLSQCFTFYNDGYLWQMVTICLAALLYLTFYKDGEYRFVSAYLVFLSINIGLNVKMSGFLFLGALGVFFFVFWSVEHLHVNGYTVDTKRFVSNRFILLALSAISGVLVTGATTYVTNMVRFNNPLYGLIGRGGEDPIQAQLPIYQKNMPKIQQVITSLFSRTSNDKGLKTAEWKIPFLFDGGEYVAAQGNETRVAGWGIFFSGVFLVGLCVLLFWLLNKNKHRRMKKIATVLSLVYLVALFYIPYLSWARYNVAMCYVPVAGMFILFVLEGERSRDACVYIAGMLGAVLILNMVPNVTKIINEFKKYNGYHTQLVELCEKMKYREATIGTFFRGRLFSLVDQGITEFNYVVGFSENEKHDIIFSSPYEIGYRFVSSLDAETLEDILTCAGQDNLITLMAVRDEGSTALTNESVQKAKKLGLEFGLANDGFRKSYCAVLDRGLVVYEEMSDQRLSYKLMLDGHEISLESAGYETGNLASIQVDGVEYALNKRGINIVFINRDTWNVIDSIRVDSYLDNKVYR